MGVLYVHVNEISFVQIIGLL